MPDRRADADAGVQPPRGLYLGAAVAVPFAVVIWTALLGTIFARL